YRDRPDFMAAQERLRAAEAARSAAVAERLPSLVLDADYGAIGLTLPSSLSTFTVTGTLKVPIFDGNKAKAHIQQATVDLNNRKSEFEDLRAQINYDVRSAFLDLQANSEELDAATQGATCRPSNSRRRAIDLPPGSPTISKSFRLRRRWH